MKYFMVAMGVTITLLGIGCVIRTEHTIEAHITLDIRHVADQAEDVLDFIEGKTNALPGLEEGEAPSSRLQQVLDYFDPFPSAYAAELKNTTSPLITEIAVQLRKRNAKISALKEQGCLGENNRGYVELQKCDALSDAEKRNTVQKVLAEENKDRKALYKEIARLNKDDGLTVSVVETIYANQRLKRAQSGEIVQLPAAGEQFDELQKGKLGKKLGEVCRPNAWVTLP